MHLSITTCFIMPVALLQSVSGGDTVGDRNGWFRTEYATGTYRPRHISEVWYIKCTTLWFELGMYLSHYNYVIETLVNDYTVKICSILD